MISKPSLLVILKGVIQVHISVKVWSLRQPKLQGKGKYGTVCELVMLTYRYDVHVAACNSADASELTEIRECL